MASTSNDGIDDRDEMGVCVEPMQDASALWVRSSSLSTGRQPSARAATTHGAFAGDLDLTIYSLRKWMRLALKGNPTILLLPLTPEDQLVHCDSLGSELRALTPAIISRRSKDYPSGISRPRSGA